MSHPVSTFLRLLCIIDGRTTKQCMTILGISRATLKRHIAMARRLGCEIRYSRADGTYTLAWQGPFRVMDLQRGGGCDDRLGCCLSCKARLRGEG